MDDDIRQVSECIAVYASYRFRNCHIFERTAPTESPVSNGLHILRNNDVSARAIILPKGTFLHLEVLLSDQRQTVGIIAVKPDGTAVIKCSFPGFLQTP